MATRPHQTTGDQLAALAVRSSLGKMADDILLGHVLTILLASLRSLEKKCVTFENMILIVQ